MLKTISVLCLISLSGCAIGDRFDARGCPQERKYTKAEQDQFLADLPKTPKSIQQAMVDYGRLRDKAKACRGDVVG